MDITTRTVGCCVALLGGRSWVPVGRADPRTGKRGSTWYIGSLSSSAPAAGTRCHRREVVKQRTFPSHSSGGWEAQGRGAGRLSSSQGPLPAGRQPPPRVLAWGPCSGLFLPYEGPQSRRGPPPMTSSKPNHLPKVPPPGTVTLGVRASTQGSGGQCTLSP